MLHAGCVFVASIHLSRTWMSGSFESVSLCDGMHVHRLELDLYSDPKEILGNRVSTHVNCKVKLPSTWKILPGGGWNPWSCIKQDSKPNTLPTSYLGPAKVIQTGSHVYHHSKFERNPVIRIWTQANHLTKVLPLEYESGNNNKILQWD